MTESDKNNIQSMLPGTTKYCSYSDDKGYTQEEIRRFMKTD